MDDSPFRQTFELGILISPAEKNLVNPKFSKILKILKFGSKFKIKSIQNLQNSNYIFHILQYFATKLHHFTKFEVLFPPVLINIRNSSKMSLYFLYLRKLYELQLSHFRKL